MTRTISIRTSQRNQFIDITSEVRKIVGEAGIDEGLCTVHSPHTTGGITINENADPDVVIDILGHLNRMVPNRSDFRHFEGNSDSHIKKLC